MSTYSALIKWIRGRNEKFVDNQYSRAHTWEFDGGVEVPASSSPHIVPLPHSVAENVDPEEAFIAALSSCHMLVFLAIAAKRGYVVEQYVDDCEGVLEPGEDGRVAITKVVLKPVILFTPNKVPTVAQLEKLHHMSHQQCFIANSVTSEVITEITAQQLELLLLVE
jgi:organic hydroperoxide reductase OsmC/OhrA